MAVGYAADIRMQRMNNPVGCLRCWAVKKSAKISTVVVVHAH